jgi:hypothetical protein
MGGKKSGQTIGYHYMMTLLIGDCRGPVNEYLAIEGDDKIAWQGNASERAAEDQLAGPVRRRAAGGRHPGRLHRASG